MKDELKPNFWRKPYSTEPQRAHLIFYGRIKSMDDKLGDRFGNSPLPYLLDKALKNTQEALKSTQEAERKARLASRVDNLTRIGNRLAFDEELAKMIKRLNNKGHRRETDPDYVVFILLDMNRLKFLNDKYGHLTGDKALKAFTERFKKEASERKGEIFRFAGDEFVMIQEGKGDVVGDPVAIATRIQEKINSGLSIPTGDHRFDITVSVGCSILRRGENKSTTLLMNEAEEMMYMHKQEIGIERGK